MKFYKSRTINSDITNRSTHTNTHHNHWKIDLTITQEIKENKKGGKKGNKKNLNSEDCINIRLYQNSLTLPALRNMKNLYIHLNLKTQKVTYNHLPLAPKKFSKNLSFHHSKNFYMFQKSPDKGILAERQYWIGGTLKGS